MKRVLMVKTHALGDVLMVTPAIRAFKKKYLDSEIDFLVGNHSSTVLKNNPYIDNLIQVDESDLFKIRVSRILHLIYTLRKRKYDLCIVFQPSSKVQLLFKLIGAKFYIGFNRSIVKMNNQKSVKWRADRNIYVVEDFLKLVLESGAESDGLKMDYVIPDKVRLSSMKKMGSLSLEEKNYVVFCPCGGRNVRDFVPQKIWPEKNYAAIARKLYDKGLDVVVTGVREEEHLVPFLLKEKNVINQIGKLSVDELAVYIQNSLFVLTNDSFPMHLSLALGTPFVPIFGPSRRRALLPQNGNFSPVESTVDCAPCYDNEPFPGCNRFDCIQTISIDKVWEHIENLMGL